MKHLPPPLRGFAVIAAIFLVVVLAALGAFMLSVSNTQQLTSAQDLQGSRAYWAARAGLEWAIAAVPAAPASAALCSNAALTPIASATAPAQIDGFNLRISCAKTSYVDGTVSPVLYRMESQAATAAPVGSIGYVERSVTASMEK